MTKAQVIEIIKATIQKYGFEVRERGSREGLPSVMRGIGDGSYMDFIIDPKLNFEKSDFDTKIGVYEIEVTGGVSRMGTNTSVEELMRASEEIKRGADMITEFQQLNLTYTVTA